MDFVISIVSVIVENPKSQRYEGPKKALEAGLGTLKEYRTYFANHFDSKTKKDYPAFYDDFFEEFPILTSKLTHVHLVVVNSLGEMCPLSLAFVPISLFF